MLFTFRFTSYLIYDFDVNVESNVGFHSLRILYHEVTLHV